MNRLSTRINLKLLTGIGLGIILIFMPFSSAAPTQATMNDPTGDVTYYKVSGDSYNINQNYDFPELDITELSYDYSNTTGNMTVQMSFDAAPVVDTSRYYASNLLIQGSDTKTLTVNTFFSNYFGAEHSQDETSNNTLALVTYINSSAQQFEVQNLTTYLDGNSLQWEIDLGNFTNVFIDSFDLTQFTGQAVESENPGSEDTSYYIDQVLTDVNTDTNSGDSENPEDTSLPVYLFAVPSTLALIGLIRKR